MFSSHAFITTRRTILSAAIAVAMVGCATTPAPTTVVDVLASTPSLSTFNALVAQAGLRETLQSGSAFTVFAPTNDAFKAVPASTLDDLNKHPQKLKDVLNYHIIVGTTMAADVKNSNVKTLLGANAALSRTGDFVTIESAVVSQADLRATNGVVHTIDTVLMPPKK